MATYQVRTCRNTINDYFPLRISMSVWSLTGCHTTVIETLSQPISASVLWIVKILSPLVALLYMSWILAHLRIDWVKLWVMGFIPLLLLSYFVLKIYCDIVLHFHPFSRRKILGGKKILALDFNHNCTCMHIYIYIYIFAQGSSYMNWVLGSR